MTPEDAIAQLQQGQRDLWARLNEQREMVQETLRIVSELRAMLAERCEARMARIDMLERTVARNSEDIVTLKQFRAQVFALAAVGSMVGGAAVAAIFRWLAG